MALTEHRNSWEAKPNVTSNYRALIVRDLNDNFCKGALISKASNAAATTWAAGHSTTPYGSPECA